MASAGPRSPSAAAQIVATWNSVGNVYSSDDQRADSQSTSAIMAATGFGFSADIPSDAVITGILIEVEGYGAGSSAARRGFTASPTKDGSALAGDRGTQIDLGSSEGAYKSWGGDGSMWGTTWTPAEINASTFGVLLQPSGTNNYVRYVDHVRVTVYYLPTLTPNISDGVSVGESGTVEREAASLPDRNINVSDTVTKTELAPTLLESEVILSTTQGVTPTEVSPTLLNGDIILVTTQGVSKTEDPPSVQVEDKPPLSITLTGEHAYVTESSPTGMVGELSLLTTQGVTKTESSPTLSFGEVVVVISESIIKTEGQPTGEVSEIFLLTTQGMSAQESGTVAREGGEGPDINVEVNSNTDAPTPEDWIEYKLNVLRASRGK